MAMTAEWNILAKIKKKKTSQCNLDAKFFFKKLKNVATVQIFLD